MTSKEVESLDGGTPVVVEEIKSVSELKEFLLSIKNQLNEKIAPPIYALTAMNYIFNQEKVYDLFDNDNRELAREIWLALQQSGLHLRKPPLLFAEDDPSAAC